jgi:DNA polymerase III alpha subunit
VILRGHDFLLRNGPRELLAEKEAKSGPRKIQIISRPRATNYVPLRCHSYYSFLDSTLSPAGIVQLAKQHDLRAVALTDTGNLHGVVEFVQAAQATGIKPIIGTEVRVGSHPTLLYAANATGYFNVCRLLSRHAAGAENEDSVAAKQRAEIKRSCLAEHNEGLFAVSSIPTSASIKLLLHLRYSVRTLQEHC